MDIEIPINRRKKGGKKNTEKQIARQVVQGPKINSILLWICVFLELHFDSK